MSRLAVPANRRSRSRREAGTHARAGRRPTTPTPAPKRDPAARMRRARRLGHTVEEIVDLSAAAGRGPVQRALPPGAADTKNLYSAQKSAKKLRYAGGRPAKFSTGFKQRLLDLWRDRYNIVTQDEGGDAQSVLVAGSSFNYWVPVTAFQIDHHQPWDTIEKTRMPNAASEIQGDLVSDKLPGGFLADAFRPVWTGEKDAGPAWAGTGTNAGTWPSGLNERANQAVRNFDIKTEPTVWGARMYYHDVDNLVPMAGSENASKSSATVGETTGKEVIEGTDTHVVALGGELAGLSGDIMKKFDLISRNFDIASAQMPGAYPTMILELDSFLEEMKGFSEFLDPLYQAVSKGLRQKRAKRKRKKRKRDL